MIMETQRLRLREYTQADYRALQRIISDPETMRYYEKPYDEKGVQRWLDWNFNNYADLGFGLWAIELKENGQFIGDCGITLQIIHGKIVPEIGYHIHKDHWRRGYASEAARACRDWIFSHTPFQTVYSYMNAENVASWSTAARNGMRQVDAYEEDGMAMKVYAITRQEWEALR